MKKRNLFLTSTLAASLLLAACNTAKEDTKEDTKEEERAIEDTIEETEPVRDEETTDETKTDDIKEEIPSPDTAINNPAEEQTPVTSQPVTGVVTDSVTNDAVTESATAAPLTAVDTSQKKSNEVVLYKGDENAEKVIAAQTVAYTYRTNGPITKYIIDQLGYSQYYNKHSVSADERVIMIDFNESILSSQLVQGSASGLMFQNSVLASIFENIPTADTVKLRVNGKEEVLDHVSFAGEVTRAQFENSNY